MNQRRLYCILTYFRRAVGMVLFELRLDNREGIRSVDVCAKRSSNSIDYSQLEQDIADCERNDVFRAILTMCFRHACMHGCV
ncbi:MAG: hypothetical protein GY820_32140 [Gammaproteobacteria bacterium]|nr:hypothetical protein [Gammaproteobacteria bacterium]